VGIVLRKLPDGKALDAEIVQIRPARIVCSCSCPRHTFEALPLGFFSDSVLPNARYEFAPWTLARSVVDRLSRPGSGGDFLV
jgi:hypothetical protein